MAVNHLQGYAGIGANVETAGIASLDTVVQCYPLCTVTVYDTGTLDLATLYSDRALTPLANPFLADDTGYYAFYVDDGNYDIHFSGTGIDVPFTFADVEANSTAGSGSVTSVGLTMPPEFAVANSPVTSAGTLAVTKATQAANTVWAGPSSGAAAVPTFRALAADDFPVSLRDVTINFLIDGMGAVITTGIKGDLQVDFACTILSATLLADQSGDVVVDIWKDAYANFPPTDADSITAAAPPTIVAALKSQDTALTGWTTAIAAGDILRFNVDSITTIERLTVALKVRRS